MARGLKERIFFPVTDEGDEDRVEAYLEKLKAGPENKKAEILVIEGTSPRSSRIKGYYIVLCENPGDKAKAREKKYQPWQRK